MVRHIGFVQLAKLDGPALNRLWAQLAVSGRKPARPNGPPSGLSAKSVENVAMTVHRMLRDAVRWEDPEVASGDGGPSEAVSDASADQGMVRRVGGQCDDHPCGDVDEGGGGADGGVLLCRR